MLTRELLRVGDVAVEHPIGGSVAREVLTLRFDTEQAPSDARMAIDDLTKLHLEAPVNTFCKTMDRIHPNRKKALGTNRLASNRVPLIRLRVDSMASLTHAEQFFKFAFKRGIELSLHIRMPQSMMNGVTAVDTSEEACEYLSRLAVLLEKIQSVTSNVKITVVELVFGAYIFDEDSVVRAASQVSTLALRNSSEEMRFKVAILVSRSSPKRPLQSASLSAWGELLQSVCQVDAQGSANGQTHRDVIRYDEHGDSEDLLGNSLHVKFSQGSDTRLVAAFWSAVAFGQGYSSLHVDELEAAPDLNIEDSQVRARYAAFALTSSHNSFSQVSWLKGDFTSAEMYAMEQVKEATSPENLATMMWYRPWNLSREGHIFQVETLNRGIVEAMGIVVRDPDGEWVDLLVPGFCQCSIKRKQLPQLKSRPHDKGTPLTLSSLQMQLKANIRDTAIQLSRLFQLIGSSLTKLDVHTWKMPLKASTLLVILTSCPHLLTLTATIKVPKYAVEVVPGQITCRGIKWLCLSFAPSSSASRDHNMERFLCQILPLVGNRLEKVQIHQQAGYLKAPHILSAFMTASPRLRNLAVHHIDIDSLEPVIEAYRERRTELKSLTLIDCCLDRSRLTNFATFLAFSTDQMLMNFRFNYKRDDQERPVVDKAVLLEFLSMLQTNKVLQSLRISLGAQHHHLDQYKKHFQALNGRILPIQASPVPFDATLALLSALLIKRFTQDPDIVRFILSFAASRVKREVMLEIDE